MFDRRNNFLGKINLFQCIPFALCVLHWISHWLSTPYVGCIWWWRSKNIWLINISMCTHCVVCVLLDTPLTPHREAPQLRDDPNLRTMLKSMILEALAENFKASSQSSDSEKGQHKGHHNNSWTHKESARAHISDAEYELKEWAGRCVHNTSDWGEHTGQ